MAKAADGSVHGGGDRVAANASGETVAVALTWRPGEAAAPQIVAGGRGRLAERIIAEAHAHNIPVRADPDLAAILSAIEIGCLIPEAAFAAVAEMLVCLYRINGRLGAMTAAAEEASA